MTQHEPTRRRTGWLTVAASLIAVASVSAQSSPQSPLEPPDRSSPRATLTTLIDSIDRAWALYSAGEPGFRRAFLEARESLDLSETAPLVTDEVSAETALILKEILDRIELPPLEEIPDQVAVEELGLTRWTLPHTEIRLVRLDEGERQGRVGLPRPGRSNTRATSTNASSICPTSPGDRGDTSRSCGRVPEPFS